MKNLDFISPLRCEACLRRMRTSVKDVDPINRRRPHDDIVFDREPMPRFRRDDAATLPGGDCQCMLWQPHSAQRNWLPVSFPRSVAQGRRSFA
jgi:hypothetical protein